MQPRRMFYLMEQVMDGMGWDYQTMMKCIHGLARGGDLEESWVICWLERQLKIMAKEKICSIEEIRKINCEVNTDFHS